MAATESTYSHTIGAVGWVKIVRSAAATISADALGTLPSMTAALPGRPEQHRVDGVAAVDTLGEAELRYIEIRIGQAMVT